MTYLNSDHELWSCGSQWIAPGNTNTALLFAYNETSEANIIVHMKLNSSGLSGTNLDGSPCYFSRREFCLLDSFARLQIFQRMIAVERRIRNRVRVISSNGNFGEAKVMSTGWYMKGWTKRWNLASGTETQTFSSRNTPKSKKKQWTNIHGHRHTRHIGQRIKEVARFVIAQTQIRIHRFDC